jgi:hypothetical protein
MHIVSRPHRERVETSVLLLLALASLFSRQSCLPSAARIVLYIKFDLINLIFLHTSNNQYIQNYPPLLN